MQKIRVFINGFGRIGRALTRRILDDARFEIVGINDLYPFEQYAYLLQYDSIYGALPYRIVQENAGMSVAGRDIRLFREARAEALGLGTLGVDILFQCSGEHLTRDANAPYLDGGAKKVMLSAPPKDDLPMFVAGVNGAAYDGAPVFSAASCSANAIAPVLQLLQECAGIEAAGVSMIHSYTAEQRLLDAPTATGEPLRGRSAAANILPLSSSATRAVERLLPELMARVETHSIRVPVPAGTLYDFNVRLRKPIGVETLNGMLREAAQSRYRGLLAVTEGTLASSDIVGDPHGVTLETARTKVVEGRFARLLGWQDNEVGYVAQMLRLAANVASWGR